MSYPALSTSYIPINLLLSTIAINHTLNSPTPQTSSNPSPPPTTE
jgi:hypothetical protein